MCPGSGAATGATGGMGASANLQRLLPVGYSANLPCLPAGQRAPAGQRGMAVFCASPTVPLSHPQGTGQWDSDTS